MNRTLKTVIIFSIIFLIIIGGSALYFLTRDTVGIPNNSPYFGMSKSMLVLQKGQPDSVEVRDINQTFILSYNDDIYGNDCVIEYTFFKSKISSDLIDVKLYTENIDFGSARIVFNKVLNNQINLRSNDKGYSYTDSSDESVEHLAARITTNDGATGITFEIEYKNNGLTINSNYLW